MGKRDVSRIRTVVFRLGGQKAASPSGVVPQSKARTSSLIFRGGPSNNGAGASISAYSPSTGQNLRFQGTTGAATFDSCNGHAGRLNMSTGEETNLTIPA